MKKLLMLLVLPVLQTSAQDLTGVWRGTFFTSKLESLYGSNNKFEVQIDNGGRACKGVTYSYTNTTFYAKASLVGMWSPKTKNLIFTEDKVLEYRMEGDKSLIAMFTCYLEYRKVGNKEILEGDYSSKLYNTDKDAGNGKIYLERMVNSEFEKEDFLLKKEKAKELIKNQSPVISKPDTIKKVAKIPVPKPKITIAKNTPPRTKPPVVTPPKKAVVIAQPQKEEPRKEIVKAETDKKADIPKPVELPKIFKERKNELVQTILTPGPEISIELYDNGEIDGDIISVFQNGKLIASQRGLSTVPITLKLKIDEDNPEQEITMVAENLGSIPPNTALMIVKSGGNRYDLRISSSEQKNAVVRFKYQKE